MSDWLAVRHWRDFQHYLHRRPPWIKLHRDLLDDREYRQLPAAARCLLIDLWLIASEHDGMVRADPALIAFRVRAEVSEVIENMAQLIAAGFLEASNVIPLAQRRSPKPSSG